MENVKIYSFSLWLFAATILSIFSVIAMMVYFTNKDKLFRHYGVYCFLILSYVLYIYNFTPNPVIYSVNKGFGWGVQVLYHSYYMLFGVSFLELSHHRPRLDQFIRKYARVLLWVGSFVVIIGFIPQITRPVYSGFFSFVFLPIHLSIALTVIVIILRIKSHNKYYFVIGSLVYMIFAMTAYVLSYDRSWFQHPQFNAIDFFYVAIILECFIFSYGLANFVQELHRKKEAVQKELVTTQLQIQQKLEEKIEHQEQQNIILHQEKQKQVLISQVLSLQQKVMRSQINSHFIFNVLNSIKLFILENDAQNASLYLGKFARFIRNVLDSSMNELVNLSEELETIELYLNIEKMRFNDIFNYEIDVQENINLAHYPFPPLFLQPFVENALWHGLMQIEKDAHLIVRVYTVDNELNIEVDDNGIGYKKSIAHKKNGHKSLGLKIAQERIEHYNKQHESKLGFTIIDKSDVGSKTGTIARITLTKSSKKNKQRLCGQQLTTS